MLRSLPLFFAAFVAVVAAAPADKPLPPREAPLEMTLPQGFKATLFAGEPDVVQPIAFTFDDRGRMWVVECLSYPQWVKGKEGTDRVVILEDTDHDGTFDKKTVFWDKGANLTSIALGFGGVWLCSTPNLVFVPDRDGDDKPDGGPEVLLDGWDLKAKHNVFNALTWGPDGWLYGCNGILSNSVVGKPGASDAERVKLNCGVWRYHPTRKTFEAVAHGTTNPWGLDFDDHGQMFITNCVIHHAWHVVPGAHYERMFGQDINPHSYQLIRSPADHIHWGGGPWTSSRGGKGVHDSPGGGHAHSGAMVYLGDNWPKEYRNGLFMCNIHGARVNHDILKRKGAGYVLEHGKDFLLANDPWFRGIAIHQGPDGAAYVSDWTDTGECHNYVEVDRRNGRIYKVTHGKATRFKDNLARLDDAELVKRHLLADDWQVRHARRLLQERAAAGKVDRATHDALRKILNDNPDVTRKLRALWTLHVTGGLDEKHLLSLCEHPSEYVRAWAVTFAVESGKVSDALHARLVSLAETDDSPFVRLWLASALQRLPAAQRWDVAERLTRHEKVSEDEFLTLMVWYGVEGLAATDSERALGLLESARLPLVRAFLTRRLATLPGKEQDRLAPLVALLGRTRDAGVQRDVLRGLQEALSGRREMVMPPGWKEAYARLSGSDSEEVLERSVKLAVLFNDSRALEMLRKTVADRSATPSKRESALRTLVFTQKPEMAGLLLGLLEDRALRSAALKGLAGFDDPKTPEKVLALYPSLTAEEKADAVHTLASRPRYALALLDAVDRGHVARKDVSLFTVRQLQGLKNREVSERLAKSWGTVRPTPQEKQAQIRKLKGELTQDQIRQGDRSQGRLVFARNCAACHKLFDDGKAVGPELTGSQRNNIDYVLENLVDPSAVVPREFQVTVIELKNGRILNGIIRQETDKALTLQTENDLVQVPTNEIESRSTTPVSMMPEGVIEKLSRQELRDLIAYLASPEQVTLPKER